jgi:hypothetical protein
MKKYFVYSFYSTVFFLLFTIQIFAQTSNQNTTKETTTEADEKNSDLVITATVRAKELKFETVPTPKVDFPGTQPRQTVWEADRTNLPPKVEPGVVYRDIGIRLRIYSRFAEIQRIVIEALDETEQPQSAPTATPQPAETTNQTNQPVKPAAKP